MNIAQLTFKPERGMPMQTPETLHVSKAGGIAGDFRSTGNQQISLWNKADQNAAANMQPQGLCMRRFSANIIIDGLENGALNSGDTLKMGDVEIRITQVGKNCFPNECSLPHTGVRCPLQSCLYGSVETDGVLRLGDTVEIIRAE
ncbi:hypothetical protein LJC07_04135 [Christensenellaceae bacterium OttesenSCG-928-L17]|nr:hypothetical protein [Christensenellaceae bacterium OttesenSCG-928-L17]